VLQIKIGSLGRWQYW